MSKNHTLYYTNFGYRMEILHKYPDGSTGGVFGLQADKLDDELRRFAAGLDGTVQMVYVPTEQWTSFLSSRFGVMA